MSEENVFGDPPNNSETNQQTTEFVFNVGDRKYDADSAAKKISSADEHIAKLEKENAEMREKLIKATTLDAVLQSMNKDGEKPPVQTGQQEPQDIEALVERTLSQRETQRIREANVKAVDKLIKERYGEQAKEIFNAKINDVGLDVASAMEIAAKSPKAFMKMFDDVKPEQQQSVPNQSTQRTQSMSNDSIQEGTYAWYAKMRKDNPTLYNSPTMQRRMIEDANKLGKEKFFS